MNALNPWLSTPVRIRKVVQETDTTFTWTLDPPDGAGVFPFAPGQFNMLYQFGVGEVAISISGDPAKPERIVHTIRAVGTVTQSLRAKKRGDTVGLRGPYGSTWPLEALVGRDVVVVAGGLGLAPLRPAILHVLRHRKAYGRVVILVGARSPSELVYRKELERWAQRKGVEVLVTVDSADRSWTGPVGVVPDLLDRATFDPARTTALVCGPEVMMRFTLRALARLSVPDTAVYVTLERNMKCAVGLCGRCQLGPAFLCKDGPVFRTDAVRRSLEIREC